MWSAYFGWFHTECDSLDFYCSTEVSRVISKVSDCELLTGRVMRQFESVLLHLQAWHRWIFWRCGDIFGLVVRTEAGVLRETAGYFQVCLQQPKPDIFQGQVGPSVAVFLATEPCILKVHLGTFPSVFVAIESRYLQGLSGHPWLCLWWQNWLFWWRLWNISSHVCSNRNHIIQGKSGHI